MTQTEEILAAYKKIPTINGVRKTTGYSWQKIVKTLSSEGVVINDTHSIILNLYKKGMSIEEISKTVGYKEETIMSYLPRVRPVYNENPSRNALRIKKCRSKKEKQDTE